VRCRCRNSVANVSMLAPTSARGADEFGVANHAARFVWRWARDEAPVLAQTPRFDLRRKMRAGADRSGKFPTATRSRAVCSRSRARVNSSYISAIFNPKVVGSAWIPWLRPIIGVNGARALFWATVSRSAFTSAMRMSADFGSSAPQGRIDNIAAGQAKMQPAAGGRADVFPRRSW